jgi:molybdate transport system ATP-binding protein
MMKNKQGVMKQRIIEISGGVARKPEWRMAEPFDFLLESDEHIAIVGDNASGKSMLVDMIIGRHPLLQQEPRYDFSPSTKEMVSDNIKYITFQDSYGDKDSGYFLQQRWNQQEIDETTPTVGSKLSEAYALSGEDTDEHRQFREQLYDMFSVRHLMDKYLILLSSGEMRKFQLITSLLSAPRVLIMDNPFIGLDVEARQQLRQLLEKLTYLRSIQIILVLSRASDIPDFITHVVEVKDMVVKPKKSLNDYLKCAEAEPQSVLSEDMKNAIRKLHAADKLTDEGNEEVVNCHGVSIVYGERTILKSLDWCVKRGEHWALSGQNGAGKSTLLSLVCADNPQSYACDIDLFGKKRGSGESIWQIKRHIGYVSPEMHRAYKRNLPTIDIVASGLFDSVGLYCHPNTEQLEQCSFWMNVFGLEGKQQTPFLQLSSGEQRLALIARAFVKDPDLLILDEPLHGLDNRNRRLVKDVMETFCEDPLKTMIMVTHYKEELPPCITNHLWLERHI